MSDLAEITRCYTMAFERACAHSAQRLWRALTDADEVSRWMGRAARVEGRVGGEYRIDFEPRDRGAIDGVIVRFEPARRLAYVWGMSVVEWTIRPDGERCRYRFVHHGQTPGMVPDEGGIAAGWHAWLEDLALHLAGRAPAAEDIHFSPLLSDYRARVEAALGGASTEP